MIIFLLLTIFCDLIKSAPIPYPLPANNNFDGSDTDAWDKDSMGKYIDKKFNNTVGTFGNYTGADYLDGLASSEENEESNDNNYLYGGYPYELSDSDSDDSNYQHDAERHILSDSDDDSGDDSSQYDSDESNGSNFQYNDQSFDNLFKSSYDPQNDGNDDESYVLMNSSDADSSQIYFDDTPQYDFDNIYSDAATEPIIGTVENNYTNSSIFKDIKHLGTPTTNPKVSNISNETSEIYGNAVDTEFTEPAVAGSTVGKVVNNLAGSNASSTQLNGNTGSTQLAGNTGSTQLTGNIANGSTTGNVNNTGSTNLGTTILASSPNGLLSNAAFAADSSNVQSSISNTVTGTKTSSTYSTLTSGTTTLATAGSIADIIAKLHPAGVSVSSSLPTISPSTDLIAGSSSTLAPIYSTSSNTLAPISSTSATFNGQQQVINQQQQQDNLVQQQQQANPIQQQQQQQQPVITVQTISPTAMTQPQAAQPQAAEPKVIQPQAIQPQVIQPQAVSPTIPYANSNSPMTMEPATVQQIGYSSSPLAPIQNVSLTNTPIATAPVDYISSSQ